MADTKYFAVVTDSGAKEMFEAVREERKVNITHFAAGDGGGQYYVPDVAMTGLKNEVWRGLVTLCRVSGESENVLVVETVVPSDAGGFTIREMAVFDENGTMIAICNTPDTAKVRVTDGVVHELLLKMEILLNNKESVQLTVDPNVVVATKSEVLELGRRLDGLELKINWLVRVICGYSYDAAEKQITGILPHEYAGGILAFPEGVAHAEGSTIVLDSPAAGSVTVPGGPAPDTGPADVQEIARAAARIVEGGMQEISAEQVREAFDRKSGGKSME